MSRFDRYMLSQLLMFFGFFALVLVSVYWVNSAVRLFDRLIADGQSVWVFLEMTALSLPNVVRQMLPVAAFVAVVYTMNRLAGESELVVMQATGFSPWRILRPVLVFGLIVAALLSVLTHVLVPASRARFNDWNDQISQNISSRLLSEGTFLHPAEGLSLYIRDIGDTGELSDILLTDDRQPDVSVTYTARRAFLARTETGPKIVMVDGMAQTLRRDGLQLAVTRFADFTYDVGALMAKRGPRVADIEERPTRVLLAAAPDLLAETGASRAMTRAEGHGRFASAALALVAACLGFAAMMTGGFSRRGQWPQIALASGLFLGLFMLMNAFTRAAVGSDGAVLLVYAPAVVGLLVAAGIVWFSNRPRRSPAVWPEGAA